MFGCWTVKEWMVWMLDCKGRGREKLVSDDLML